MFKYFKYGGKILCMRGKHTHTLTICINVCTHPVYPQPTCLTPEPRLSPRVLCAPVGPDLLRCRREKVVNLSLAPALSRRSGMRPCLFLPRPRRTCWAAPAPWASLLGAAPTCQLTGGQTSRLRRLLCRVLGSDTRGMLEAPRVLAPAPGFITEAGL